MAVDSTGALAAQVRTGPPGPIAAGPRCRCGHDAAAHEHFRPGSDCGACGAAACARLRREGNGPLQWVLRRVTGRD